MTCFSFLYLFIHLFIYFGLAKMIYTKQDQICFEDEWDFGMQENIVNVDIQI